MESYLGSPAVVGIEFRIDIKLTSSSMGRTTFLLKHKELLQGSSKGALLELYHGDGMHHEFTAGFTPHQNGVVERRGRYVIETSRYMLMDSRNPSKFWAEVPEPPYSRMLEPNVLHLKVLGS